MEQQIQHIFQSDIHLKLVESWEKKNVAFLPVHKKIKLFGKAIQDIERRTLKTLSSVTLMVILDRVLKQSKDKYPVLSEVIIESDGISFERLFPIENQNKAEQLLAGVRYMLVEILSILGSITSDILTTPLHKELLKVTWELSDDETQNSSEEK